MPDKIRRPAGHATHGMVSGQAQLLAIVGPTACGKKFPDEASAQRECDNMNAVYNKGFEDGKKTM